MKHVSVDKTQADVAGISQRNIKVSEDTYQDIDLVCGSDFLFTAAAVEMI